VGLTGEIKKIPSLESRLKEADRMGMSTAFIPYDASVKSKFENLSVKRVRNLKDVIIESIK
jgi:DNA repair protein RadA/Sms